MKKINKKGISILLFVAQIAVAHAQEELTIQVDKPVAEIAPTMWGIFFEDINFAADGGIYAEMVKNRSFEFYNPLMGWKEEKKEGRSGKMLILNRGAHQPQNPRFARISVDAAKGDFVLSNEGFRGMGLQQGKQYDFSVLAKKVDGGVVIRVNLVSGGGKQIGTAAITGITDAWTKHTVSLTAASTDPKAHLELVFEGTGTVDADLFSLFPKDTWKNRPNGLRKDLVQMLADLKPGFIRFPGGCIVEGHELETRYQWKKTVGNLDDRTLIINRWNTEMRNRQAPDYFQSYGLGFFEYFQLAEDLGAEPLPILNCGMACQYNTGEVVPADELDPYIQDALDLVEFANGTVTTRWGKLRADMGHPQPFNLKMIGIGNEQWDLQYVERYALFDKALKTRYPSIQLVSSSGPLPDGDRFDYLWSALKKQDADLIDEHYYKEPAWFLNNASRYDHYDRGGPKVFAGEYAAHSKEDKTSESRNSWISALSEAAFMTGLERNAGVVKMASYAPLLAHVDAWQWRPDLIWFDNLRVAGTPNYYVQKMFSTNKGTHVLEILKDGKPLAGADSIYASSAIDKEKGELIVKLVNASAKPVPFIINITGAKLAGLGEAEILSSTELYAYNTLDQQKLVYPREEKFKNVKNKIRMNFVPMSFTVIRVHVK